MTKRQSKIIQGIAILLMIYHHFFLNPEELSNFVSYVNIEAVRHIAWFGKICVGLFCFVSGYGLVYSVNKIKKDSTLILLKNEYISMLYRILQLYIKFWLVLFIFILIKAVFFKEIPDITGLIENLTGINPTYNGSWWYLIQYVEMLLLFPLLDLAFTSFINKKENKKRYVICLIALLTIGALYLLTPVGEQIRPAFLLVFIVGFIVARFNIYESLKEKNVNKFICLLMLILAVVVRIFITKSASFAMLDFVIVPVLCFCILPLIENCKVLGDILGWFGKISVWLWLIHICVYDITLASMLKITDSLPSGHIPSFCFYLIQLGISTIVALGLDKLYRLIKK